METLRGDSTRKLGRIIGAIGLSVLLIGLGLLVNDVIKAKPTPPANDENDPVISTTFIGGGFSTKVLRTVKHDEHWFVIGSSSEGISILHHPDCPKCGKKGSE